MSDTGDEDEATRAFEMLREEVAGLRKGIELIYRQTQDAKAVDYSLTLGQMTRTLQTMEGRLVAIEGKPILSLRPDAYRDQVERAGYSIGTVASEAIRKVADEQKAASDELKQVVGRIRQKQEQRAWLATTGVMGVFAGLALWMLLVVALPWHAGTWLAALPLGNRWNAGERLMLDADPAALDKMLKLSDACGDQPLELCAAHVAVNSASTGLETPPPTVVPPAQAMIPASRRRPRAGAGRD
ncbi:MAG: DUF6118 family protein [Janthinobacterium lividum]